MSELLSAFRELYTEGSRAWNEGDMETAYGVLPDDVDFRLVSIWPSARPLHGRDEVIGFFTDLRETFSDLRTDPIEFIEVSKSKLVAGSRVTGSGASSKADTTMEIWQVWDLGEGLVPLRITEFLDRSAALEAARGDEVAVERAR